jgi:hypothetical protein
MPARKRGCEIIVMQEKHKYIETQSKIIASEASKNAFILVPSSQVRGEKVEILVFHTHSVLTHTYTLTFARTIMPSACALKVKSSLKSINA